MWRYLAGAAAALLMVAAGWVLLAGRTGRSEAALPAMPPVAAGAGQTADALLPDNVPEASERTREQKRFDRYDKDRDGTVTREEYLAQRRKAYARLDLNHDGMLSFDEWAAKAINKFAAADHDKSGSMNATEFATTKVARKPRPQVKCAPRAAPVAASGDDDA